MPAGRKVGTVQKLGDEYVFQYEAGVAPEHFVSLAMPVRMQPWIWPRDLHPVFRQNLPEGFLLSIIREDFGPLLDGTDLSVLAVVGSAAIGRVTLTLQGQPAGTPLDEFDVGRALHGDNTQAHFADLVRRYARAAISGAVPKFLVPQAPAETDGTVQAWAAPLKTWAPGNTVSRFFSTRLNISSTDYARMVEALCDAALDTGKEVIAAAKKRPEWRDVAAQIEPKKIEDATPRRASALNGAAALLVEPDRARPEDVVLHRRHVLDVRMADGIGVPDRRRDCLQSLSGCMKGRRADPDIRFLNRWPRPAARPVGRRG